MAIARFISGFGLLRSGWRVLSQHKSLWLWVSIPWTINMVILIAGWVQGVGLIQGWVAGLVAKWAAGGWLFDLFYYPLLILFGFGFVIFWLVAVMAVATVIAAPFNAILAEKALLRQGYPVVETNSLMAWLRHAVKMLGVSSIKATVFAVAGAGLFIASFIPGVNLVAAYLSVCLFAADVFDYGFEAQGWDLSRRIERVRRLAPEVFGLGAALALTSLIPGLTVVALPVAVVGATTLMGRAGGNNRAGG